MPAVFEKGQGFLRSLKEDSSLIRKYIKKYRSWLIIGLTALIVVDLIDILPALLFKQVVDVIVERRPVALLGWLAAAYFGISVVQGVCRYIWRMYLIRASILAGRDIRSSYVQHLFHLGSSFYDRHRMGDLLSLATSDVDAVRIAIGSGLLVFADAMIYLLTVPVAMLILSPKLTLLACIPLPFIPWIVLRNEKEVHQRFQKVQECYGRISGLVQENLNGIRVVKAFAREDAQLNRLREIGREYMKLNLSLSSIQSALGPTMDFAMSLGMVILLLFGGRSLIGQGNPELSVGTTAALTLGTFVAFQRYIQKMVWPMAALGLAINFYQRAVSSSYRLKKVLAIQADIPEPAQGVDQNFISSLARAKSGNVEFRDLTFCYPGTETPVLKGIRLRIEAGERVAFIGSIGAGKSALLSLLPRLYPVPRGKLWIDQVDINEWPLEDLRRQVGFVGQEIFLFSETIQENVAFGLSAGLPDELASALSTYSVVSESVEGAARLAEVHDEIVSLSGSYETKLEERGSNLSGGQRQRLTLARALAIQPSILVLDDALSAVDTQTEEKILNSLRSRPDRNTEMIAAHRISTVRDADRIVVLRDGLIAQVGTHAQLIKRRGEGYWQFYEQQRFKEELEIYQNEIG